MLFRFQFSLKRIALRRFVPVDRLIQSSLVAALLLSAGALHAGELAEGAAAEKREALKRLDPMDTTGLDRSVANILRNYYRKNFTSASNWEQIESIRFDGTIHLSHGVLRFTAFKKKPDYCKVVIYVGNGGRVVMAYDGADAWQLNTLEPDAKPVAMPEAEAINFIRDATTGGHLFYPQLEGKQITLMGTADVDGQRAYHLRIQLPDGQLVHSFLDMTSFAEVRQVATNQVSGDIEVNTHSDFREIDGVNIPFTSTLTIDGQRVHQSRMYRVQTDVGVMPWMFSRPSGADLPGGREVGVHAPMPPSSISKSTPAFGAVAPGVQMPAASSVSGFVGAGLNRDGGRSEFDSDSLSLMPDMWGPSPFIDSGMLSDEEVEVLSQQVDEPIVE